MRRKIRALAAEGRTSALILASLPFFIFAAVHLSSPNFYGAVWHLDLTKKVLLGAGMWMSLGLVVMYRMVNFKI
jgi:tight adherence protein B